MPRAFTALIGLLVLAAVFGFGLYLGNFGASIPKVPLSDARSVQSCVQETIEQIKPTPLDTGAIGKVIGICSAEIQSQGQLNDFQLRRIAYLDQYYADRITLWMVVVITLSGVLLAGLQLAASYRLARVKGTALADGNELTVEQGKLIFRSSVTGLMVLAISFGFFLAYARYIYPLREEKVDPPGNVTAPTRPNLLPGGFGPPPAGTAPTPDPAKTGG